LSGPASAVLSAAHAHPQNQPGADEHVGTVLKLSNRMLADVVAALDQIKQINKMVHILSMNARVEAARAGHAGRGFAVVAQELTRLSTATDMTARDVEGVTKATGAQLDSVAKALAFDVTDNRLCDLAANAMDLIDRNLYERTCDVRWWATDSSVVDCLARGDAAAAAHASMRLGQILDSYTVYSDLVLCDLQGNIVANGRPQAYAATVGTRVSQATWFQSALKTRDGTQFGFESVHPCALVGHERSLVYSCVVREGGRVSGRPLGVLGIVFRWDALGQQIIEAMPLSAAEWGNSRATITDASGRVLADSDPARVGSTLEFAGRDRLVTEARGVKMALVDGIPMRVCHARSAGFETYATHWHCLVLRRVDAALATVPARAV